MQLFKKVKIGFIITINIEIYLLFTSITKIEIDRKNTNGMVILGRSKDTSRVVGFIPKMISFIPKIRKFI